MTTKITSVDLQMASYNLRLTSYNLPMTSYELPMMSYVLQMTSNVIQGTSCDLLVTEPLEPPSHFASNSSCSSPPIPGRRNARSV